MKQPYRLPLRNWVGAGISLVVFLAASTSAIWQTIQLFTDGDAEATPAAAAAPASLDEAAARAHAWDRAQPLLAAAERQATATLDKRLDSIHAFLDERKPGARAFAERLLSLRGKWELVKSHIGDQGDYAAFLQEAFGEHLFAMQDLEKAVATAVRSYLAELESIEEELLVRLRADLADDELPRTVIPVLRSEQALRSHYHELSQRVAEDVRTDLGIVAGREVVLWQATNVATDLTLEVGAAVVSRLGISSTILAAGAASTWRTLGVGLVVGFVLDVVINRIIKAAGYDAEEKVAERVVQMLDDLGRTITDGDPEARATLKKLKAMQKDDPNPEVRAACTEAVGSMEAGTRLYGLRRELTKISAARASLRKETLRRLIHDREVTP
jgi:hypothetical protein